MSSVEHQSATERAITIAQSGGNPNASAKPAMEAVGYLYTLKKAAGEFDIDVDELKPIIEKELKWIRKASKAFANNPDELRVSEGGDGPNELLRLAEKMQKSFNDELERVKMAAMLRGEKIPTGQEAQRTALK